MSTEGIALNAFNALMTFSYVHGRIANPFTSAFNEQGQVKNEPATDFRRFPDYSKVLAIYMQEIY